MGPPLRELARAGAPAPAAPGDPAALVEQVLGLCADPDRRTRHAAAAARYAQERLTFAAAMRELLAVLDLEATGKSKEQY